MTDPRLTCPICMHREAGLIPAPRHVPAWDNLTGPEQMAMLAEVGAALGRGTAGFAASSDHDHFHLRKASGTRLTTGGRDPLLPLLVERLDNAQSVDLANAFAMDSGVALLEPWFRELMASGGRLRIVVGDYLDTTDPTALARLLDLEGAESRAADVRHDCKVRRAASAPRGFKSGHEFRILIGLAPRWLASA